MAAPGLACADKRTGNTQLIDNRRQRTPFEIKDVALAYPAFDGLVTSGGLGTLYGQAGLEDSAAAFDEGLELHGGNTKGALFVRAEWADFLAREVKAVNEGADYTRVASVPDREADVDGVICIKGLKMIDNRGSEVVVDFGFGPLAALVIVGRVFLLGLDTHDVGAGDGCDLLGNDHCVALFD